MGLVTVFTPVYNRAYIIGQLYESLCKQTCKDFEWVVVNDGSTDNIDELIQKYIHESKISIRYFKQENGGKHRAINRGVHEANGELFFIVDSDDYLTKDAIEWIKSNSKDIIGDNNYAGLSGIRKHSNGKNISAGFPKDIIKASPLDIRFKYKIKGDLAEIWKTEVLKLLPFPEFEGEKFVPEALIWNRIGKKGLKLLTINKGIYICEYLKDGLTSSIIKIRMKSANASSLYYSELLNYDIPLIQKVKSSINYWRFWFCRSNNKSKNNNISYLWWCTFPLGYIMHLKDKYKTK